MNTCGNSTRRTRKSFNPTRIASVRGLALAFFASLILVTAARGAEGPDEHYVRILRAFQQAESLRADGQLEAASAKFQSAQTNLLALKKNHPAWNPKLVAYRLNWLAEQIAAVSQPAAAAAVSSATSAAPAARTTDTRAVRPSTVQVALMTGGNAPRQVLRLRPKPGQRQTLVMTIKGGMDMGTGQAISMPTIQLTVEAVVGNVSSEGNIDYEMKVVDATATDTPDAMPQLAEILKTALDKLKGLSTPGTLTDRGLPASRGRTKTASVSDPQARQFVEQVEDNLSTFIIPLPEEAIGPGAKWEVTQQIKSQGMTIQQIAVYELLTVENQRLTLKSALTQSAANQKIESPAMPGFKVDLVKMTGRGTGTATLDLTQPFPSAASLDAQTEMAMSMAFGGQKQSMTMKNDQSIRIESP